jgi:GT2 family glycosyltransferase
LERVINACLDEGVHKIIVVDNNSEENSRIKLIQYEKKLVGKLKVIYLKENTGSAGGYHAGLVEASNCDDCDFLWLLDDDNMPKPNSLNSLLDFWNNASDIEKEQGLSMLSYRSARTAYREAIMRNDPDFVRKSYNSFMGFHVKELPSKIIRVVKKRLDRPAYVVDESIKSGKISLAPYGGMFLDRNLLNKIGFPDEKYFVYKDDHEWTYRITKNGGAIYLILDSLLEDIDVSWDIKLKKETMFDVMGKGSEFRIYYNVRNRIFFEKDNLITSNCIYKLNMRIYLIIFNMISFKKKYTTRPILMRAIRDGFENRSGKIF